MIQRASTMLASTASQVYGPSMPPYGRHGTATHAALKAALGELEGAQSVLLVSSGLLACTIPLMALAEPGAHFLVVDTVYGPTRRFCDRTLSRLGCRTEYFAPGVGGRIKDLLRPETRAVFIESPGSLSLEICDTPAIAEQAKAAGVTTIFDNTWSGGLYHQPLDLGVDVSVQSATKYISGAADVLGGAIFTRDAELAGRIEIASTDLGLSVSPDDAFTLLRGLRTLPARLAQHSASGLKVAEWLSNHKVVRRVIHPALQSHPDHELWARDFTGSSGLFSFVLDTAFGGQVNRLLDGLQLFGQGFSYGGFESLAIHCNPQMKRTAAPAEHGGPLIRLAIGLEDPNDLIADLDQALGALASR